MSDQISTSYVQEYTAGLNILFQQKGSIMRPLCRFESFTGTRAFFDGVQSVTATPIVGRNQPTALSDTPFYRRSVTTQPYGVADTVDPRDVIRILQDPQGTMQTVQAYALGRAFDDVIIAAALGSAWTGVSGTTEITYATFAGTQTIGLQFGTSPAADTGLTLPKIREAARLLNHNQIPQELTRYLVVTAKQMDDLLAVTQITSTDFNTRPVLVDGLVRSYMGFNVVMCERLSLNAAGHRSVLAFAKGSLLAAANPEITVDVGPRRDLSNVTQIFSWGAFGATRMDEIGIVEILCHE